MDPQVVKNRTIFFLSALRESIFILHSSPYTFILIALTFIFPLSFAILANTLVSHPPFIRLQLFSTFSQLLTFLLHQFSYLMLLFSFSLFVAAVVCTVSSFYTSKSITFMSILSSIPFLIPRLHKTLVCVSAVMLLYYATFFLSILALLKLPPSLYSHLFVFTLLITSVLFIFVYSMISVMWHLTSVVSILESVCAIPGMKKSHELLRGLMEIASDFIVVYLVACVAIVEAFKTVAIKGPEDVGALEIGPGPKLLIVVALVGIPMVTNIGGFLLQSIFYYACKTYYPMGIDMVVSDDNLDKYLGDDIPLKSSVDIDTLCV